jgi:hypothetical protein
MSIKINQGAKTAKNVFAKYMYFTQKHLSILLPTPETVINISCTISVCRIKNY